MSPDRHRAILAIAAIGLFLLPMLAAATPVPIGPSEEVPWWEDTLMDKDKDGIQDNIWIAIEVFPDEFVDEDDRIGVIVDFDHLPTSEDERLLADTVDFVHQHTFHLIDSIAGTVPVERIEALSVLPGVVMVELDGIMQIANSDVKDTHGVWDVYEATGYDGAGSVVSIIDTGIDGNHVGLDDMDDDNATNDPKIIAFYDVVNNPGLTNGSEIFPYDDQGHGSHCAGTTAGTGAPTYEHTGVAPQAQLVGVKVLDAGGSGSFAGVMMGMEWTVEKRHEFNIRAASMSLGGFGDIWGSLGGLFLGQKAVVQPGGRFREYRAAVASSPSRPVASASYLGRVRPRSAAAKGSPRAARRSTPSRTARSTSSRSLRAFCPSWSLTSRCSSACTR